MAGKLLPGDNVRERSTLWEEFPANGLTVDRAAMKSSHPSPMPWDQYAEECVGMLTSSPLAQPSDIAFCYYVSLQQVAWDHSQRLVPSLRPTPLQVQEVLQSFNQINHAQEQRMSQMNEDGTLLHVRMINFNSSC